MYFKAFVEAGSSICYAAAALAQSYSAENMKSSRSLGDEHTHQSIPGQQLAQENSTLQPVHTHVLHQLHMPHHQPQTGAAEGRLYDCRSATLWLNRQYLPELPPPPSGPKHHALALKEQGLVAPVNRPYDVFQVLFTHSQ